MAKRIDPERAKELLDGGGYQYIDVRTPEEFELGHVPAARNIPFMVRGPGGAGIFPNKSFLKSIESQFDKEAKLILGCRRGGRSLQAADMLTERGYSNVLDMRGGFFGEADTQGRIFFPGWETRRYPTTVESRPDERYRAPK